MASKSPRELVKEVYPYKKWWVKVDRMTDAQVYALLVRFRNEGKLA